jgi:hypothetical protein
MGREHLLPAAVILGIGTCGAIALAQKSGLIPPMGPDVEKDNPTPSPTVQLSPEALQALQAGATPITISTPPPRVLVSKIDGYFDYGQGGCHALMRAARRAGMGDYNPCTDGPEGTCYVTVEPDGTALEYPSTSEYIEAHSTGGQYFEPGDVVAAGPSCDAVAQELQRDYPGLRRKRK